MRSFGKCEACPFERQAMESLECQACLQRFRRAVDVVCASIRAASPEDAIFAYAQGLRDLGTTTAEIVAELED